MNEFEINLCSTVTDLLWSHPEKQVSLIYEIYNLVIVNQEILKLKKYIQLRKVLVDKLREIRNSEFPDIDLLQQTMLVMRHRYMCSFPLKRNKTRSFGRDKFCYRYSRDHDTKLCGVHTRFAETVQKCLEKVFDEKNLTSIVLGYWF